MSPSGIAALIEAYSQQGIRENFERRLAQWRAERMSEITAPAEPKIVGRWQQDSLTIDFYDSGKVMIWFDPTFRLRTSTGEGLRENTASLRGYVELTPRPASSTRTFANPSSASSSPTQLQS